MGREPSRPVNRKYPRCERKECPWRPHCLYPVTPCRAQPISTDAAAGEGVGRESPPEAGRESPERKKTRIDPGLKDALLEVCVFRSSLDPAKYRGARMIRCRSGDIEFLSDRRLKENSRVHIRIRRCADVDDSLGALPEGIRSAGLARVIECRPAGCEDEDLYRVLAQYY